MIDFFNSYIKANLFFKSELRFRHYIAAPDQLVDKIYKGSKRQSIKKRDINEQIREILSSNTHFNLAPISKIQFTP